MAVLEISNLTKRYGNITALNGLNLRIEEGQVFGLLGPNGSGKTTTLGIILGILAPDSGTFSWFGESMTSNPRKRIGAILETPNFYPYLNAQENLAIVSHIKKSKEGEFDEVLKLVNLYERRNSKFRTYSLGMKQRLAIAATMIGDPDVVIFDEPTNGLDPQGIAEVRSTLSRIASTGKTVIMASHILDEVEKICSHVAIIKKGNLLATGSVGSILSSDITLEIKSPKMMELTNFLSTRYPGKPLEQSDLFSIINLPDSVDLAELSTDLFKEGIVLTHFAARKRRLEEEFLAITQ